MAIPLEAQTVSQMVDPLLALDPESMRWMLLAPVIRERKGEHVQVFEQLRAQGFVRARVDGALYEIDAVPPLALRQKHTIEAVIDRFKVARRHQAAPGRIVRDRAQARRRHGDGAGDRRRAGRAHCVLVEFSCPVCDYSLPELEPRLFSFNSPVGACPACDGLGVSEFFDPARVVVHPESRSRPARCAAGTGAMPTTSS